MGKFIAVCGSPESGKTVTALKLAQEIYEKTRQRVLFFSPDLSVPLMGYIFPHCKESDLYSIGKALDQTDIYKEDVLKRVVTVKTMTSFGYLGFKAGENKYTYPRPTEDKVLQLLYARPCRICHRGLRQRSRRSDVRYGKIRGGCYHSDDIARP